MIIFLYGPDSYRRGRKVCELVAAYQKKHKESDILSLDLSEDPGEWVRARDFLSQPSMFTSAKVAVLGEVGSVKEKEWLKVIKKQAEVPDTFLIISDSSSPRKDLRFLLKEPVRSQEFEELKGAVLTKFFNQEASGRGLEFAPDAERVFLSYLNSRPEKSWLLVNELEKLSLAGLPSPISLAALGSVVHMPQEEKLFSLTGRVGRERSAGRRLAILEQMFLQKEAPAHVFNLLAYGARGEEVVRLAEYDVDVKSGRLEYEEALTDFALNL